MLHIIYCNTLGTLSNTFRVLHKVNYVVVDLSNFIRENWLNQSTFKVYSNGTQPNEQFQSDYTLFKN